jgi:hypothetical protein
MDFLPFYQDYLEKALSKSKFLLLRILVWLLQVHKQVRIERLAGYLPIPILYQSRSQKDSEIFSRIVLKSFLLNGFL